MKFMGMQHTSPTSLILIWKCYTNIAQSQQRTSRILSKIESQEPQESRRYYLLSSAIYFLISLRQHANKLHGWFYNQSHNRSRELDALSERHAERYFYFLFHVFYLNHHLKKRKIEVVRARLYV